MFSFEEVKLEDMIHLFGPSVYRMAFSLCKNRSDADDVYQEVFIAYLQNQPSFVNEHHAKAWFLKVCSNACKKIWRQPFFAKTEPFDETFHHLEESKKRDYEPLYQALQKLPLKYRVVLHLFYFEEYTTLEMSDILGVNESTLRTRLSRGRSALKDLLGSDYVD